MSLKLSSYFTFLKKNKLYTVINLLGLSIAIAFVITIGDYTYRLLSADKWHKDVDNIYLMGSEGGVASSYLPSHRFAEKYSEIEKVCCFASNFMNVRREGVAADDLSSIFEVRNISTDSTFFDLFSFKFIAGEPERALSLKDNVVITESLAKKVFGDENPLGMRLTVKDGKGGMTISYEGMPTTEELSFTVSGVIKDIERSVIPEKTEMILRIENNKRLNGLDYNMDWFISGGNGSLKSFIKTYPGSKTDITALENNALSLFKESVFFYKNEMKKEVKLIPLKELIFSPLNSGKDGLEKGNRGLVSILLFIGAAILLFAVTNYINLTVAQTGFRAKEMASRKLLGATERSISFRLISESVFMVFIAFIIGFVLSLIIEPTAAKLFGGTISVMSSFSLLTSLIYLIFILIVGAISGVIPAITLARYKPIDIVKGNFRYKSKMVFSKIFISFQNIITVCMITASLTIILQLNHLINLPLGYKVKNMVSISPLDKGEHNALKEELSRIPSVKGVTVCSGSPLSSRMFFTINKNGKEVWVAGMRGDKDFLKVFGAEVIKDYNPSGNCTYLNEACYELLELSDNDREFKILDQNKILGGVVKNFKIASLTASADVFAVPTTIEIYNNEYQGGMNSILLELEENADKEITKTLEKVYKEVTGRDKFSCSYLSDVVKKEYDKEKDLSTIVIIFTLIAIIISSLGLLAMSTYFIQQRKKEVGIRKIMGSTRREILIMLLNKFTLLIAISFVISIPIAYYIMNDWLSSYTDRISLTPWIFLTAGAFTLIIAILTVLWQSLRAANTNPVESIKVE